MTLEATVLALGAVLDGRPSAECAPEAIVEQAIRHRVSPLLARTAFARQLPGALADILAEDVRLKALHAAVLDDELRRLLGALRQYGLTPLVTKGAHLAHTLYPAPHLRPRADTDLLIAVADRRGMREALAAAGYVPSDATTGSLILGEFAFERRLRGGVVHYVDVHWRAAAPLVFERAFDVRRLAAQARPVAGLGPDARGPALHHALALGCVHVVAHHWDTLLLLWLYDLRLMAEALDAEGRRAFVDAAIEGRYCDLAYCALKTTRLYFESAALDALIETLAPRADGREPSAVLTHSGRRPVDDLLLDLRGTGWRGRFTLLREHVLPPPAYMRAAFGDWPLPIAYTIRLLRGVRRWF
jgi:hypothetical protein